MKRVAVIDIGSNSIRLLVADVQEPCTVIPVYTDLKATRLGQGIEGRMLLPGAVCRTVGAIMEMQARALEKSAPVIVAVATSAVRDAVNRDWFLDEVFRKTNLAVRVLEGEEEAYLSYLGVAAGFGGDVDGALIIDIGGGSTEFTWSRGGRVVCRSVNAGAVRMTEGGHGREAIAEILREAADEVRRDKPRELIGVGGTVTTLSAMDIKMEVYSRDLVHGYVLPRAGVLRLREELISAGPEGRKRMPGLQPARADIILAGVNILLEVMSGLGYDRIRVSEADLMYGLALRGTNLSKQK